MNLGTAQVIRANARHLPLADDSVDLVVTSPPYFALRSYQDGGEHYAGQIGDEPTPAEFVASLLEVTAECVRVLKPSGSLWVNLGDKYASSGPSGPQRSTGQRATRTQAATYAETSQRQRKVQHGIAPVPESLGIDHFAAFPTRWPERIIRGWSPAGVCVECGEGRRPVAEETGRIVSSSTNPERQALLGGEGNKYRGRDDAGTYLRVKGGPQMGKRERVHVGYACACSPWDCHGELPPTRPAVVLDPFGGTGTTAMVAKALGRHGISVDMSADYCRLAQWRTNDRNQLAKVLGVDKAPAEDIHQLDLFAEEHTA